MVFCALHLRAKTGGIGWNGMGWEFAGDAIATLSDRTDLTVVVQPNLGEGSIWGRAGKRRQFSVLGSSFL
jgi:hypothetical protein